METFYIKFYDLTFKICAEKKLFENSFYSLLQTECTDEPNYVIRFCGSISRDLVEKYCVGKTIANYMGNKYYSYKTDEGESLKINIDGKNGAHMIKCRENQFDIYNIGEEKKGVWAVRICQDLIVTEMIQKGFVPVHAAAVKRNNNGILIFGNKGDGKSTTMFSLIEEGYSVMSNDFVFLGSDRNSEWTLVGWPWKVTIGNSLLNITNYKYLVDNNNVKTQFYPLEFSKTFKCQWAWESKLSMIIHPHLMLDQKLQFNKFYGESAKKKLLEMGLEYSTINCIFTGKKLIPNFEIVFDKVANKFPIYNVDGDIWEYKKNLSNFIEETL